MIDDDTPGVVTDRERRHHAGRARRRRTTTTRSASPSGPTADVDDRGLTDGLTDVVSIDGVAVTPAGYIEIGGIVPSRLFLGNLIDRAATTITRGAGSDLGSFVDEGFAPGQHDPRSSTSAARRPRTTLTIVTVTDRRASPLTGDASPAPTAHYAGRHDQPAHARRGSGTAPSRSPSTRPRQLHATGSRRTDGTGWLADGFLEGQRDPRLTTAGQRCGDFKIALIRGTNATKDDTLEFTHRERRFAVGHRARSQVDRHRRRGHVHADQLVRAADRRARTPTPPTQVPLSRQGVKVFPVSHAPAVEAARARSPSRAASPAPTARSRTASSCRARPTARCSRSARSRPRASRSTCSTSSTTPASEDGTGVMTSTTLRGFGMAEDLAFAPARSPVRRAGDRSRAASASAPIAFVDGQFQHRRREEHDRGRQPACSARATTALDIQGTLDPGRPPCQPTGNRQLAGSPAAPISRAGFDWKAAGFLVGQTITVTDYASVGAVVPGTWTITGFTGDQNDVLHVSRRHRCPPARTLDDHRRRRPGHSSTAPPYRVAVAPWIGRHHDARHHPHGPELGGRRLPRRPARVHRRRRPGRRPGGAQSWRVEKIVGNVMTLRGATLPQVHGGAFTGTRLRRRPARRPHRVHGGGNRLLDVDGTRSTSAPNSITRLDGLAWADDGYAVGDVIQVGNERSPAPIIGLRRHARRLPVRRPVPGLRRRQPHAAERRSARRHPGPAVGTKLYEPRPFEARAATSRTSRSSARRSTSLPTTTLTRDDGGSFVTDGFIVGMQVTISGFAGPVHDRRRHRDDARARQRGAHPDAHRRRVEPDPARRRRLRRRPRSGRRADATMQVGGDHIVVCSRPRSTTRAARCRAAPSSAAPTHRSSSTATPPRTALWYSGDPSTSADGHEFGDKPFNPFVTSRTTRTRTTSGSSRSPTRSSGRRQRRHRRPRAVRQRHLHGDAAPADGRPHGLRRRRRRHDHRQPGRRPPRRRLGRRHDPRPARRRPHLRRLRRQRRHPHPRPRHPTVNASPRPNADNLDVGQRPLSGSGVGTIEGGPASAYDDIVFGDHGLIVQDVADPNLPQPKLQRIQTTIPVLLITTKVPDKGGDDIIFGGCGRDLLIGGAGHDMLDGDCEDDILFGDNVSLVRRVDLRPGHQRDRHAATSPACGSRRSSARCSTAAPTCRRRERACAVPNADNSGQLLVDNDRRVDFRDNNLAWWADLQVARPVPHVRDRRRARGSRQLRQRLPRRRRPRTT